MRGILPKNVGPNVAEEDDDAVTPRIGGFSFVSTSIILFSVANKK
jgi:hypothetical protein